jgi:putative hydrolases of HD superfamily
MLKTRLCHQIDFLQEIDTLKQIFRRTYILDGSRRENDAEHSWHLAMMALLLSEYAGTDELNLFRVVTMVLLHDVIEIDAGDTYLYDVQAAKDKAERELRAADRIFGLLPEDQEQEFRTLWEEFEARVTPEARFAALLDRLQPLIHNYVTKGASWQEHGVTSAQVKTRWQTDDLRDAAPVLWDYAQELIHDSVERGYLAP